MSKEGLANYIQLHNNLFNIQAHQAVSLIQKTVFLGYLACHIKNEMCVPQNLTNTVQLIFCRFQLHQEEPNKRDFPGKRK